MAKIHTILFDAGETLVQADGFFSHLARALGDESLRDVLARRFFSRLHEKPFSAIKDVWVSLCAEMVEEFDAKPVDAKSVYADFFINTSRAFPEAVDVLRELRGRGIRLVLVSDADADVLRESLDTFRLTEFFDGMVISSEQLGYKPDCEMVDAARRYCAEPLDGILFVGDMDVDMEMAERLGVCGVLIDRYGAKRYSAPFRIRSLRELFNIIGNS